MKFDCNYNLSWDSGLSCLCEMGKYNRSFGCISLTTYLEDDFLFLNENICYGYSKEPSQWDGSFQHPKLIFQQLDMNIIAIKIQKCYLSGPR